MAVILVLGVTSCGDRPEPFPSYSGRYPVWQTQPTNIEEVGTPRVIQDLRQLLEVYQPQVTILSPQPDELFNDSTVTVDIAVEDLPLFKDPQLGLGPHLEVILDNQPYIEIYDLKIPLVLTDLPPGTHSLRVFADRPWDESFKNEGAYAQTTFHIFTKTEDNNPDRALPLLTYNSPDGSYGSEPILLDFYLSDAPLHLVAQEYPDDDILDWRIRCTINGESFYLDQWQPIYLKGFKPGKNWVQLEFIDELGRAVKNEFNNTVRLITYEPNGQDTQSRLLRGELAAAAQAIVDPNYTPSSTPEEAPAPPEVLISEPETTSEAEAIAVPEAQPSKAHAQPETTSPELLIEAPATESESQKISEETTTPTEATPLVEPESAPEPVLETPKSGGLFEGLLSRFRRTAPSELSPAPTISDDASPEVISPSSVEEQTTASDFSGTVERPATEERTTASDFSGTVETPTTEVTPSVDSEQAPVLEPTWQEAETLAPPASKTPATEVKPSVDSEQAPVNEPFPTATDAPAIEMTPSVELEQTPVPEQISSESETNATEVKALP
ncbi:MAG: hypothetical protein GDA43_13795 [Hormoscilla sp. SP5CHS1]|nr:hypothetical protein [Hormoscilla sp. SP5CHS1]